MPTDNSYSNTEMSTNSYLENCHPTTEPSFTGRKGIPYDWYSLLLPSDTVFEATLNTLLSAEITNLFVSGDIFTPNTSK